MRLHHPLWTHVPAVLLVAITVIAFWRAWPLPDPAPVHFGGNGLPDRWGAWWEMPVIISFVSMVAIGISLAVDETWARSEQHKRFNWFSLVDELLVAFLAVTSLQYIAALESEPYVVRVDWWQTFGFVIAGAMAATVLEIARPHRFAATVPDAKDASRPDEQIRIPPMAGKKWAYWESQNPGYTRWLFPLFGGGLLVLGINSWGDNVWAPPLAILMGATVLLTCSGGFRTTVTPSRLTLRGGLIGIPLLKLRVGDLTEVDVHSFSPLADFGGYGIRRNRKMMAFFLQGNRGVRLTTAQGKTYLIGSDQPERLAAVLNATKHAPFDSL